MNKTIMMIVFLFALLGAAHGQTISITSPPADSTITTTSTRVVASATTSNGVKWTQIYLDGVKVYQSKSATIDTYLSTPLGSHRLTLQAFDGQWKKFQKTIYFTVATSQPSPSPIPPVVAITAPTNATTMQSPVTIQASAASSSSQVATMKVYLDYKEAYTVNAASLSTSLSMPAGVHDITVNAWDSAGNVGKSSVSVTVEDPAPPPPPPPTSNDRYISPTGSDSNDGSYGSPWKTFAKANSMAKPGYVIHVALGTYTFYPTLNLSTSGTSSARVQWVSDVKGAAKIVSSGSTSVWDSGVVLSGSYIDLKGFDITGTNTTTLDNGVDLQGNYNRAIGNIVHDIVAPGPQGVGGCGICSSRQSVNGSINTGNEAVGNLVYNIGNPSNPTANPRVHGIYWSSRNGYIANNIVHHSMSWGIQLGHAADHGTIINNTIFSNGYGGIVINVSTSDNDGVRPDYMFVANNIVYNNGIGYNAQGYGIEEYNSSSNLGPNNSYVNNLVYNNKPSNWNLMVTGGSGQGTISAVPGFVNWQSSGSGDYHLAAGSPAIDRGTGTKAPSTDYDGSPRPVSGVWDIGAYEKQ